MESHLTRFLCPFSYIGRYPAVVWASHRLHSASDKRRNANSSCVTVPNSNAPPRYMQRSSAQACLISLDPSMPLGMTSCSGFQTLRIESPDFDRARIALPRIRDRALARLHSKRGKRQFLRESIASVLSLVTGMDEAHSEFIGSEREEEFQKRPARV